MKRLCWGFSHALLTLTLVVSSCAKGPKGRPTEQGAAGAAGEEGAGSTAAGGTRGEKSDGTTGAAGSGGGAGSSAAACEDEYPFDDGYSCEEQAAWGKCNESWLLCYCHASCNRCDAIPPECSGEGADYSGQRNVFSEYTEKQPLAPTPPMGWNSWNRFGCSIDEDLVRQTADAMVDSGMADLGYQYVNIDDCWQANARDADGNLVPDPDRFPSGMKALADYVHDLGLKIGIYSDRGTSTCGGFPGSFDHEIQDAETFADWGIDYLKYDNCNIPVGRESGAEFEEDYAIMGEALRQSGRDIVYSVCAWWFRDWMPEIGHLWRTTTDIKDIYSGDHHAMTRLLNWNGGDTERYGVWSEDDFTSGAYPPPGIAGYAGPSGWNDPDMLEVGNGGMTDTEYRSHFSLWALMAAPLLAGNDLRNMSDPTLEILTNEEVIAVDQDELGIQGVPVSESTELEVWAKQLSGDDTYAVILFNRTEQDDDITVSFSDVGLESSSALVRDLWLHEDIGVVDDEYTASVPSHGVVMVTLTGQ